MTKKKRAPRVAVRRLEQHPGPYQSPLRPHLETIRAMRRARKTWQQIAEHLQQAHGVKTSFTTVYNFFKRVTERARKGKSLLPLGYEEAPPAAVPAGPAQPVGAPPPRQPTVDERPDWEPAPPPADGLTELQRKRRAQWKREEEEKDNPPRNLWNKPNPPLPPPTPEQRK